MRRTTRTPRARLVCLVLCLLLPAQPLLSASAGAAARPGANKVTTPSGDAAAHQGRAEAEAADLPDLNEARSRPHFEPKAVPPVPSTRRRCPPHNPRCDEGAKGVVQPTPTPSPARVAAYGVGALPQLADLAARSLASLASAALSGAAPAFVLPELDYYRGGGYSYTDAAPPSSYYEPVQENAATATLVDDLDDWSKSYSHTQNLTLDTSQASALGGDTSRAARTVGTGEEVVWRKAKITSFRAVAYSCCGRPISFSFYTLTDGVSWTAVTPSVASESLGGWTRYTYTLNGLPEVNYIKVRWGYAGEEAWTPQLGQVTIGYVAPQTFVDDLDDWSKTYSHSPDLGLDTSQAATAFYGDTSRAYRGSQAAGEVVWYRPGATSFQAVVYGVGGAAFSGMSFYTSADGARWSAAQAVLSSDPPGSWTRYTYSIADLRGAAYVKAAWNYAGEPLWTPQLGRVSITYVPPPPPQTFVDDLNDWSKTFSHTPNLFLDTSQASTIGGDPSRAARTAAGGEEIVWRKSGITSFRAVTYSCCGRPQSFGFYTSRDGASWSPVAAAMTGEPLGSWTRYTYTLTGLPEVGYVKVHWGYAGEEAWTPQLGQVSIGYVPPPPPQTLVDDLDDWSKTNGHTQNLFLDTSQAASFGGDSSRAARSAAGGEEVVWYRPGTTSFEAVVYSCCGRPFSFGFYTSRDGASWSSAAATLSAGQSLGGWTKYTYTSAGLPEVSYLKVRWGYAGEEAWTPQLGRLSITYTPASGGGVAGCWKEAGQFVRDFYQGALARQPGAAELQHWTSALAQAQGEEQLTAEAQGMGLSLFTSSEYAARARGDREYVADLYWAYLQRPPEQAGWDFWAGQIEACGADQQCRTARRGDVRRAFDQSDEFRDDVRRLCGTSVTSGGGGGYNFSTARLEPSNRTGSGGADPLSRDYNWSLPILSLPGRAGLDLGLTLSYNSLVWTKDRDANAVTFDADRGFPSPGFRLGFPTIEPKFYNPATKRYAYLLLTPSGSRVELRQTDSAGVYESADSSYTQLTEAGGGLVLRATDGTALSFYAAGGAYECAEVKDADGNYLSIYRWADGRIDRVVDTLGRTINFTYDANGNLQEVWQTWTRETDAGAVTERHTWATFGFGAALTLQPLFAGLTVVGEQAGTEVPVLRRVGLADGSYYGFEYNAWGQVWGVTHYAADAVDAQGQPDNSHALSSTWLNLPGGGASRGGAAPVPAAAQTDCPRFTEERVWVENGVMNQSADIVTSYSEWAPDMASCDTRLPDRTTVEREVYGGLWKKGLVVEAKTYSVGSPEAAPSDADLRRRVTYDWEHDGAGDAPYPTNQRVRETNVCDAATCGTNHRRTTVSYQTFALPDGASCSLPRDVTEYREGATAALRTTRTEYNLSAEYTGRHIIGLPSFRYVYEGTPSGTLMSKVGYVYDDNSLAGYLQALPSAASQHDGANYGASFRWRGNVSRARRYDVTGGANTYVEEKMGYYVTGTVAFTKDALDHRTYVEYADSFFQNVNRTSPDPQYQLKTYAYPTTVTDPDGFTSTASYNYDMGLVVRARTPLPNTPQNQPGLITKLLYDAARRPVESSRVDGATEKGYTKFIYPDTMRYVRTLTLLDDGLEGASLKALDGLGRVRGVSGDLPGTPGGHGSQLFYLDAMGRVVRTSNPTETDANWNPAGDESAAGWVFTEQTYDWKGRPRTTTKPKLDPNNPGEQPAVSEVVYEGCGCAGGGGEIVTGELVPTDAAGAGQGRRKQRIYRDVLGREVRRETYAWDGTTVYSTLTREYNVRDQLVYVKEYRGAATADGSCPSGPTGTCQQTAMNYDGYGRLVSEQRPEETGASVYSYNDDDTVQSFTDARGAKTLFTYNNRHMVSTVKYDLSGVLTGQSVAQTEGVTYTYDGAGNRTRMDDGQGWTTYAYNNLSQLESESRYINDLGRTFTLTYADNFVGQVKRVTDPFGATASYVYDRAGRLSVVDAYGYADVSQFVKSVSYRAWGGVKTISYGNTRSLSVGYDRRMEPTSYSIPGVMSKTYDYSADGRVRFMHDLDNNRFDRLYVYDHAGRLALNLSGADARAGAQTTDDRPYYEEYRYDERDHLTDRYTEHWSRHTGYSFKHLYLNNRNTLWQYDASGGVTGGDGRSYRYDAAHRLVSQSASAFTFAQGLDGDGRRVKSVESAGATYYVNSAALGGAVVAELDAAGNRKQAYVYAGGKVLATVSANGSVSYRHEDVQGVSARGTGVTGLVSGEVSELDPSRAEVEAADPYVNNPSYRGRDDSGPLFPGYGNVTSPSSGCTIDGVWAPCEMALRGLQSGAATVDTSGGKPGKVADGVWVPIYGKACIESEDAYGVHVTCSAYVSDYTWNGAIGANGFANGPDYNTRPNNLGQNVSQLRVPLSPSELNFFSPRVAEALSSDECKNFLGELLNEVKTQTGRPYEDVMTTFNKMKFYWEAEDGPYGGQQFYEHGSPAATIDDDFISDRVRSPSLEGTLDRRAVLTRYTVNFLVGETLHAVGQPYGYLDSQMANALNAILVRRGADSKQVFSDSSETETYNASQYWHAKVWPACKAPSK